LGPAAENLDGAIHFGAAPDQRIDLARLRLFIEIDAELLERAFALLLAVAIGLLRLFLFGALHFAWLGRCDALAHAMADKADGIETAHILLLKEIDGIAFALRKQRDEHIGAGHLVAARRLDMEDRALD